MASAAKKASARAESKDARGKSATKSKKGRGLGAKLGLRLITGRRKSDKSDSETVDETPVQVDNLELGSDVGQDSEAVEKYSLKTRFQAWWSGTQLPDLNGENDRGFRASPKSIFPRANAAAEIGLGGNALPPWGPYRVQAAGLVWGKGQVNPGDEEYIVDLVKIASLSPDMSVLDIGAGLGGAARIISERFGVWITALETSQFLVNEGMELSVMAGMAKKVPVTIFDPNVAELPEKKFKFIFSKDTFYRLENKADWLNSIAASMNQTAQFMITDIVKVGDSSDEGPLTKSWRSSESDPIHLWSLKEYKKYFKGKKLSTLHAPLDVTENYCDAVVSGWWRAQQAMRKLKRSGDYEAGLFDALAQEAEVWALRTAALQAGELAVYRFYGNKAG